MQNRRSNASQRLFHLQRLLLVRPRGEQGRNLRMHTESLQSRLLMSVTPGGAETLVNTTTSSAMTMPAIAVNPAGNSVVVWTTSASGGAVLGQRYDINGNPVGAQFQIDQQPAGSNAEPSVAIDDAGDFVVVWTNGSSVFARVFNSTGAAQTGDTLITNATVESSRPVVAMDAEGEFTVAWEGSGTADSDGIYMRQFLVNGIATSSAVLVNSTTAGSQINPAIAEDSQGDAIIAWTDLSASVSTVQAAYFAASGSTISQFPAGAESSASEDHASVGIAASGNFIIAWQTNFGSSNGDDITAQEFSAAGTPLTTNPFVVNSVPAGNQTNPTVAERADGSFIIAFTSQGQDGSGSGIYAQAYTSAGALDGDEFLVNTTTAGNQQDPAAAWTGGTAIIAWDGNGTGDPTGVFLQRYTTSGAANASPVNTVPAAQTIYQNNTITFDASNSDAISVSDADADAGVEQVALTATNGTLKLSNISGLTFTSGATATAAMTFIGTLSNINAALNGMVFTPTANFTGTASMQIVSNDLGNSGVGGPQSATSSVSIRILAPPTSSTMPGAQTTTENTALRFAPPTDNAIYIGSGWNYIELQATDGKLTLATTSGLSFSTGNGTNDATMEFGGSVAAINAAFSGLTFTPTSAFVGSGQLKIITSNGGLLGLGLLASTSTSTIAISVTAPVAAANVSPTITAPSSQTTQENAPLVVNALSVADTDSAGNPEQLTLTATSGTLTLAQTTGLTFSTGTGTGNASMTFTGTLANINAAMNGLSFTPATDFYGSGGIYVAINDLGNTGTGGALTTIATVPITITQVNQPPALRVPTDQSGSESATLNFSTANSNAITMSDLDADGGVEQLSLSTANGTLALGSTTGLTMTAGGSGQSSMTFTGTLPNINAALQTLAFTPTTGFIGTTSVQLNANDLGNSGTGGAMTASASIPVVVIQSLVVNTLSDVADGDTSSVANLLASPGADGKISLREAILAVNNTPGNFAISFDIPGSGSQTIILSSALPAITRAMTIDATTQPGYAGSPLILIDGTSAGASANGLTIQAAGSSVSGLDLFDFSGAGIAVDADDTTIQGNDIGTTSTGAADGNGLGIILSDSSNDTIGGTAADDRNIIADNNGDGIQLQNSSGVIIQNNYIGCSTSTTTYLPNLGDGIDLIGSGDNTIGGSATNDGNAINANAENGIAMDSASSGNVVQGNSLQLDSTDGIDIAGIGNTIGGINAGNVINLNAGSGIQLESTAIGNVIQGNQIGSATSTLGNQLNGITANGGDNTVGGTITGQGNVISENIGYGIEITGPDSSGNLLQGNFIGTDAAGTSSLTNGEGGIYLYQTSSTIVGGTAPGAGNLISGNNDQANNADGILIQDGSDNTVQGNLIGTDVTGTQPLGNYLAGVEIDASTNNIIGGVTPGAGNIIAYNTYGVDVDGLAATGNSIRGNSIFDNSGDGINLQNFSSNTDTLNSQLANEGMNFPSFTVAALDGNSIDLTGYVGSSAGQSVFAGAVVDVYLSVDDAGENEGGTFLGSLTADANGDFSGSISAPSVIDGDMIVATATDLAGSTSEFSIGTSIQQVNQAPILTLPAAQSMGENNSLTLSSDGGNALSVADADADGGIEQATLLTASGSLTLFATTGITFVDGTSNGTDDLVFQGTVGNINSALDGLTYTPPANSSGSQTIGFIADDLGNTGSGGPQTASGNVTINIQAVANTPSVSDASTQLDTQTTSGLVITPNASDGSAQGFYQIANITGGTLYQSDGTTPVTDGEFITFAQGLAGLKFTPTENSTAPGSFTLQAASSPGTGGLVAGVVTATVTVEGIIITAPGPQTIPQDSSLLLFSTGAGNSISVIDSAVGSGVITVDLSSSVGLLSLGSSAGITIDSGGDGESEIDITGTVAAINAAINGLSIDYTSHYTGADELTIAASDSSSEATAMVSIDVTPIAHTPTVTNAVTNEETMTTTGLVITPSPIDVGQQVFFQITNISGGTLFQSDGLTAITNGDFITAAQGLAGLAFLPAAMSTAQGSFDVQASLLASAGGLGGSVVPAEIEVIPPTAPVNQVPAAQTVQQDTPLVFSSATDNTITISNSDGNPQQVTLTATDGTLSATGFVGVLMFSTDNGSNLLLVGPADGINFALNGLTFTPTAGYNGSAQIQVVSTDSRSIMLGDPLSATSSIPISITAIPVTPTGPTVPTGPTPPAPPAPPTPPTPPTPPVPPTPPTPTLRADTGLVLQAGSSQKIDASELDAAEDGLSADQLTFTVTQLPAAGRLLVAGQPLAIGGSFTQQQINQGEIAFESTGTGKADDAFSFVVSDGSGGALPAAVFAIRTMAAVVPQPVPTIPAPAPTTPVFQPGNNNITNLIAGTTTTTITTIQTPSVAPDTQIDQAVPAVDVIQSSGGGAAAAPIAPPAKPQTPTPPTPPQKSAPPPPVVSSATPNAPAAPPPAVPSAPTVTTSNTATFKAGSQLWHDLDTMQQQADAEHAAHVRIMAGSATLVSAGMSLVYFVWAIRAGSILSSLLSSMPAWKLVDPLPILDQASGEGNGDDDDGDDDNESLQSMVDQPRKRAA